MFLIQNEYFPDLFTLKISSQMNKKKLNKFGPQKYATNCINSSHLFESVCRKCILFYAIYDSILEIPMRVCTENLMIDILYFDLFYVSLLLSYLTSQRNSNKIIIMEKYKTSISVFSHHL